MTTGVFMSEKRNDKVIRAVKISCFRNKINTGIHQYLYRIIHARTCGISLREFNSIDPE